MTHQQFRDTMARLIRKGTLEPKRNGKGKRLFRKNSLGKKEVVYVLSPQGHFSDN